VFPKVKGSLSTAQNKSESNSTLEAPEIPPIEPTPPTPKPKSQKEIAREVLEKVERDVMESRLNAMRGKRELEDRKWLEHTNKTATVITNRVQKEEAARAGMRLDRLPKELDDMENAIAMRAEAAAKRREEEKQKAHQAAVHQILRKVDEIRRLERGLEHLSDAGVPMLWLILRPLWLKMFPHFSPFPRQGSCCRIRAHLASSG
jgi:hypothetical protein